MEIKVKIRNRYGKDLIDPVCNQAKGFCKLLKQETLTFKNIEDIKEIGFSIGVVQEVVKL